MTGQHQPVAERLFGDPHGKVAAFGLCRQVGGQHAPARVFVGPVQQGFQHRTQRMIGPGGG